MNEKSPIDMLPVMLGLSEDNGEPTVMLQLFPSAMNRMREGFQYALGHPEVETVPVILHGKEPNTLVIHIPRAVLLGMMADYDNRESFSGSVQ